MATDRDENQRTRGHMGSTPDGGIDDHDEPNLPESLTIEVDAWFARNTGLGGCSDKDVAELAEIFYGVTYEGGRESVEDALAVVESFGPGVQGLNDTYARQILLASEVRRLRSAYEHACQGRSDFRNALRVEREKAALAAPPVEQPSIEDLCARIKAADDAAADGDYMLDSDDCISVLRGTWKGPLAMDKPNQPAPPVEQQAPTLMAPLPLELSNEEVRTIRDMFGPPGYVNNVIRKAFEWGVESARSQPEQPAPQASRVWRGGGKLTVADLVNNLLMLDQELPIYGAQYIEHHGQRRAIAVHPTVSRERVADERWIGEGQAINAAVIWTRAEQPAPQAGAAEVEKWVASLSNELDRETERAISQRDVFLKTGVSTASHGGSHDTCFSYIIRQHLTTFPLLPTEQPSQDAERYRKLRRWMSSNVAEGWTQVEQLAAIACCESWDAFDESLDALPECNFGLAARAAQAQGESSGGTPHG